MRFTSAQPTRYNMIYHHNKILQHATSDRYSFRVPLGVICYVYLATNDYFEKLKMNHIETALFGKNGIKESDHVFQ